MAGVNYTIAGYLGYRPDEQAVLTAPSFVHNDLLTRWRFEHGAAKAHEWVFYAFTCIIGLLLYWACDCSRWIAFAVALMIVVELLVMLLSVVPMSYAWDAEACENVPPSLRRPGPVAQQFDMLFQARAVPPVVSFATPGVLAGYQRPLGHQESPVVSQDFVVRYNVRRCFPTWLGLLEVLMSSSKVKRMYVSIPKLRAVLADSPPGQAFEITLARVQRLAVVASDVNIEDVDFSTALLATQILDARKVRLQDFILGPPIGGQWDSRSCLAIVLAIQALSLSLLLGSNLGTALYYLLQYQLSASLWLVRLVRL